MDNFNKCVDFFNNEYQYDNKHKRIAIGINNLGAVSLAPQTVISGGTILFDTNTSITGDAIDHNIGTGNFKILGPGSYKVDFVTTVSSNSSTDSISISISVNSIKIPGSTIMINGLSIGQNVNISTQAVIEVPMGIVSVLTIINSGNNEVLYTNPNIIIVKIA